MFVALPELIASARIKRKCKNTMKNCVKDNLVCYKLIIQHDTGIGLPGSVLGFAKKNRLLASPLTHVSKTQTMRRVFKNHHLGSKYNESQERNLPKQFQNMLHVNVYKYDSQRAMIRSEVILCLFLNANVTAILKEDQKNSLDAKKSRILHESYNPKQGEYHYSYGV